MSDITIRKDGKEFILNESNLNNAKVKFNGFWGGRKIELKSTDGEIKEFNPSYLKKKVKTDQTLKSMVKNLGYQGKENAFTEALSQQNAFIQGIWKWRHSDKLTSHEDSPPIRQQEEAKQDQPLKTSPPKPLEPIKRQSDVKSSLNENDPYKEVLELFKAKDQDALNKKLLKDKNFELYGEIGKNPEYREAAIAALSNACRHGNLTSSAEVERASICINRIRVI